MLFANDALVRDAVELILRESGFAVTAVASTEEALAKLDAGSVVDIVFSDIVMPGGRSGIELAAEVRARSPTVPGVLATG